MNPLIILPVWWSVREAVLIAILAVVPYSNWDWYGSDENASVFTRSPLSIVEYCTTEDPTPCGTNSHSYERQCAAEEPEASLIRESFSFTFIESCPVGGLVPLPSGISYNRILSLGRRRHDLDQVTSSDLVVRGHRFP